LMKRLKKLSNGLTVISLTLSELSACLNYAMSNGREYPLQILGLTYEKTDTYAPSGYTELFNYKAFVIDEETSYPVLADGVPEIANLVIALDGMKVIATIRISLGKKHITFYHVHDDDGTWAIMWKKKDDWFIVSGPKHSSTADTILGLTSKVFGQLGQAFIGVQIVWYSMQGRETARTEMDSKHQGYFREKRPRSRKLIYDDGVATNRDWPRVYYMESLKQRMESLLGVI